jgi:hypothetical protein
MPRGARSVSADEHAEAAAIAAAEEVLQPHDRVADAEVQAQMQSMLDRDRLMAYGFVIAMLIVLPFILVAVWNDVPSTGVKVVLLASCAVVLLYNVASMVALVRNYRRDRDFVYRRDVAHLRERAALRAARAGR